MNAAIPNSMITVLEASVTPKPNRLSGTARSSASFLNDNLRQEIANLSIRINVVSHDFADQALISGIIDYNDKFQ